MNKNHMNSCHVTVCRRENYVDVIGHVGSVRDGFEKCFATRKGRQGEL